jgi:flagellin-like protein
MNIWGKNERSWRRKNKRAVSPIIATILLVAITVVLAAVLYILIQQYTKNGSNGSPLGSAFAFSGSTDATGGAFNWYNMTIEQASSTLNFGNLLFQVKTAGGSVASTIAVVVANPAGKGEAVYCIGFGATTAIPGVGISCTTATGWVYSASGNCGAPSFSTACSSTSDLTTASYISVAAPTATYATGISGYSLYALGQGAFSGTVSGPIT